ncbi:glycosyltransferase family 4 protein [Hassallia byssoidea VB512170]|uniref:Glycosyltransferase family 4 protein n=1 Tax=Hassallia byssoidea VB512170 TaxID=1304833 RepID=A0A846HHT0_9CYAN|nr:glycosyltransferase family 4 protein [Hassalia byssoidea]NEU76498.1 glycosyltransferase family 4 protein [Hassalia byssoidea VB512170]
MKYSKKHVVLYIITKSELGGAQKNVYDLIANFHKDYEFNLATSRFGFLTEVVSSLDVSVYLISNLNRDIKLSSDFLAIKECISLIKKIKPDIIHAASSKAGVVARIAGWVCKIPVVFTAHGWGFTPGSPKLRGFIALISEKLLTPLTAKLICVCESDRQLALSLGVGNQNSLCTIRNGIANNPVPIANSSQQPPKLIMVARFNEQKDQTTLLQAIAELSNHDYHLDLVGSGSSLEFCKDLAHSLGIAEKVSFLGDRTDVPNLLAQSQIFILSTHYEGLPISILEAMRAGLPVVATSVNGIPEEVEHGKTGLLVPRKDVQALANALQTLIQSPDLRQQMGEAGRQKFEQEFTVERMINETKAVYEEILKKKPNKLLRCFSWR